MLHFNEESLVKLINSIDISSNVKDAKTGKYLISNKIANSLFGLDSMVGLTACDLDEIMRGKWEEDFIPQVIEADKHVCETNQSTSTEKIFITNDGLIRMEKTTKVPFSNNLGQVIAILTIGKNIIKTVNLLELWHLYKKFYHNNTKAAIKKYLIHTKVSDLFMECPTESELMIIILNVMYRQPGSKFIGSLLKKSPSTIDNHTAKVNEKIIKNKSLVFSAMTIDEG